MWGEAAVAEGRRGKRRGAHVSVIARRLERGAAEVGVVQIRGVEANITHEVQHYGCLAWDIPMLTVYDEFIFPENKEDAVEELMFSVGLGDEYNHPYTEIIKEHAEF